MKGYKTLAFALFIAIAGVLQAFDWATIIPQDKTWSGLAMMGVGMLVAALRIATNTAVGKKIALVLAVSGAVLIFGLLVRPADAADVATKAQPQSTLTTMLANGYPQQGGGFYYGIDTEGTSSTLTGSPASAATIQGDLGFLIGYALNLSADGSSFVFVEGLFNISNLNAPGTSGISASGPAHFEQRFAFGGPLTTFIGSFSTLSSLKNAIPSLPGLPAGITAGPQWPYLFASIHEQDVSVSYGLASGKEWLIAPGFGVGMLSRLSNNVVMDVWAEAKLQSNSFSVGPAVSVKQGNGFDVGFALKY